MSTIFGHGRLRLYLLKLLDESPRHGYEIISLLRDRFLGVYAPSPGTIYPRLARMEEEGLVTHEEVDGRKVYRLTEQGRAELHRRSADLDDLEQDLTDSVRDIARAVQRDVRDTIGNLREELKSVAGDTRRQQTRERSTSTDAPTGDTGTEAGKNRQESSPGADTGDVWERASRSDEDTHHTDDSWWNREWERLRHGFAAWNATDSRALGDLEHTLREFTGQIREIVHDAGQLSTTATNNLRQMLDETLTVLRRDLAHWGPQETTEPDAGEGGEAEQDPDPPEGGDDEDTSTNGSGTSPSSST